MKIDLPAKRVEAGGHSRHEVEQGAHKVRILAEQGEPIEYDVEFESGHGRLPLAVRCRPTLGRRELEPEYDGKPMPKSTRELSVIRLGWPVSNAWLVPQIGAGPVLIDCGHRALWPSILRGMRAHGVRPRDLAAVLLTHRHCDHAGNAARLALRHDVPIFLHSADAEVLAGEIERPLIEDEARLGRLMCFMENTFPAATIRLRPLQESDRVLGFDVLEVPGHTAGSVFLWHESTGSLFTGDALLNAEPPLTVKLGLTLPYPAFCESYDQAIASLGSFLEHAPPVQHMYAGHGPPLDGDMREALARVLDGVDPLS